MTVRIEVETVKSGQERSYGDTINHVRVRFTHEPAGLPAIWADQNEDAVREILQALPCGFPKHRVYEDAMEAHFATKLDWMRNTAPGVWEFHTSSPFTD